MPFNTGQYFFKTIGIVMKNTTHNSIQKFKATLHQKDRMIKAPDLPELIVHSTGKICPFALQSGVRVYLDGWRYE